MPQRSTFTVFADYNQFFLLDDELQPSYPESVSQSALDDRCLVEPSVLAVYTALPREVSVEVCVYRSVPEIDRGIWGHVVQGALAVPSGRLVLAGCTDYLPDCSRIQVPQGMLEFLLCGRGFDAHAEEAYLVALWPGHFRSIEVIKRNVANDG
jgi:hypothetical protein